MTKLRTVFTILILIPVLFVFSCTKEGPSAKISKSLLIYMAAENDLSRYIEDDLQELEQGFIPDYFEDGKGGSVLLIYINKRNDIPKLYRFSKEQTGDINRELIKEYEEHNSLDDSVMTSVLTYAANLFPAKYNGLVLWSHGTGWLPGGYYIKPYSVNKNGMIVQSASVVDPYSSLVKSFGIDEQYQDYEMEITDLAKSLPIHYSFILFDACLMGAIEVAYELKNKTDYLISSSAEILAGGFPYQYVSSYFFRDGIAGLDDICRSYYDYYKDQGYGATVSLVNSSALVDLAKVCYNIFSTRRLLITNLDMNDMQGYFRLDRHYFYDLEDFISKIASSELYSSFQSVMKRVVISKYATEHFCLVPPNSEFDINIFSGLSTYIPNPENKVLDEFYKSLAWNKAVQMIQ